VSLALTSPHCKINWPTCSNVVLPSCPLNFGVTYGQQLRNSITSRVRELVIVIRVGLLIDMPLTFGVYAEGLSQNSSQLVGQVIRLNTQLACSSSGHHVNWLWPKRKLRWGLVTKTVVFRLALHVVPHHVVVCRVWQEPHRTIR
jgi:hypothetical protein